MNTKQSVTDESGPSTELVSIPGDRFVFLSFKDRASNTAIHHQYLAEYVEMCEASDEKTAKSRSQQSMEFNPAQICPKRNC
jgi:hypothetical protein